MKYFAVLVFLVLPLPLLQAQDGRLVPKNFREVEIPFEYHNDLIIVTVTFNRIFPLKFIFDTGAEHSILAQRQITDLLHVNYDREFKLLGSDLQTPLTAYLVRSVHLRVGDWIVGNRPILVLGDDYFRFEELTGREIHGILGADIFRHFVVKINYSRRLITLIKASGFEPPRGYQQLPINVHRGKPYLDTYVKIFGDTLTKVRLLMDTGASTSLLLYTDTSPELKLPPNTLKGQFGMGLGGFLEGYLGRVNQLAMGKLEMNEVLTNFHEVNHGMDTSLLFRRNGIIGNKILGRFYIIFDYPKERMYLKPNKYFDKEFEFDKSGLVLLATGVRLQSITVHDVIKGSPAAQAGVQRGDIILRANALPSSFMTVEYMHNLLSKREGKRIRLVLLREGQKVKVTFRLRKLI